MWRKQHLFDCEENILYVNTKDDYNSLPSKMITALNAVNETIEYKYVFKTDDDQMLIDDNFFTIYPIIYKKTVNMIMKICCKVPDHISQYYTVHDCLPKDLFLKQCMYCNDVFIFYPKKSSLI